MGYSSQSCGLHRGRPMLKDQVSVIQDDKHCGASGRATIELMMRF